MGAATFDDFDDAVTAPLHGFKGKQDYYDRCSSANFLGTIERPTLIINALDDPFMTPKVIPSADSLSRNVTLEVAATMAGTLASFDGGTPWRPKFLPAGSHHGVPGAPRRHTRTVAASQRKGRTA